MECDRMGEIRTDRCVGRVAPVARVLGAPGRAGWAAVSGSVHLYRSEGCEAVSLDSVT